MLYADYDVDYDIFASTSVWVLIYVYATVVARLCHRYGCWNFKVLA